MQSSDLSARTWGGRAMAIDVQPKELVQSVTKRQKSTLPLFVADPFDVRTIKGGGLKCSFLR